MEEILVAVRCGDKAESLVPDEPLDRTVASSHVVSLLDARLPKPGVRGWSKRAAVKRRSLQLMRDRNSGMDPSGSRLGSHTVAPKGDCVMQPVDPGPGPVHAFTGRAAAATASRTRRASGPASATQALIDTPR